jgi:putative colanic acid biosynthesis acetyltransferase WcaF
MIQEENAFVAPPSNLDIEANRRSRKWSRKELLGRLLWDILQIPLFKWTPRQFWWIRNSVLRLFGASIGKNVHIHPSVRIVIPWNLEVAANSSIGDRAVIYSLGQITLGESVSISQHAHLCAGSHDFTQRDLPLTKPPIVVEAGAWVCADAFVGPGVRIGKLAIVGARAVITKDVDAYSIMVGNPARKLARQRELKPE